jgi:hypothetical protein
MNKPTSKPRRKAKRETARDLRAKLDTLQSNYDHLEKKSNAKDFALRELVELLRPYIEEIANEAAAGVVDDHETFHADHADQGR